MAPNYIRPFYSPGGLELSSISSRRPGPFLVGLHLVLGRLRQARVIGVCIERGGVIVLLEHLVLKLAQ